MIYSFHGEGFSVSVGAFPMSASGLEAKLSRYSETFRANAAHDRAPAGNPLLQLHRATLMGQPVTGRA